MNMVFQHEHTGESTFAPGQDDGTNFLVFFKLFKRIIQLDEQGT